MEFKDRYDFEILKNESENLVLKELEQQLETHGDAICRCNTCVVDMAAVALNLVKPLYRVSLLGTLYAAQAISEETYAASLKKSVHEAIEKVRKNPAHD